MADAQDANRPLSPHLGIYRWPITMATSILHRATGVALYTGTIFLSIWLAALASGPEAFGAVQAVYGSPFGLLVLFGYSVALFYHLLNGIRHLFWDSGVGYDLNTANASGIAVFIGAAVLTIIAWALGLAVF